MLPDGGFLVGRLQPDSSPLDFLLPVDTFGSYSEGGEPKVLASTVIDYIALARDGGSVELGAGDGTKDNVGSSLRLVTDRVGGVVLVDAYLMPPTTTIEYSESCPDTTVVSLVDGCGLETLPFDEQALNVSVTEETPTTVTVFDDT